MPKASGHLSAFGAARDDIAKGHIPPHTLIISYTGYGPVFLLDCSSPPPVHAVYGWDFLDRIEEGMGEFPVFTDFLEFCVREQLRFHERDVREGL